MLLCYRTNSLKRIKNTKWQVKDCPPELLLGDIGRRLSTEATPAAIAQNNRTFVEKLLKVHMLYIHIKVNISTKIHMIRCTRCLLMSTNKQQNRLQQFFNLLQKSIKFSLCGHTNREITDNGTGTNLMGLCAASAVINAQGNNYLLQVIIINYKLL